MYEDVRRLVETERHRLLETVGERIASHLLRAFPAVESVAVRVKKPHVAVSGSVDYLGIELIRTRRDYVDEKKGACA